MSDPPHQPERPHWSTISVGGHVCDMHAPPDAPPGRAVIHLHGLHGGSLRQDAALRDLVEAARLPVIAPWTGTSWWLDRVVPAFDPHMTPERYVIGPVVAEIATRFGVRPPGIALLGTGMGGQGALRLTYRHPALFPVAAAIAPAIDFHLAMRRCDVSGEGDLHAPLWELYGDVERARQDTVILHVHPLNWPRHQFFASDPADVDWHDGAARLHGKLVALGIPHVAVLEPRGSADPGAAFGGEAVRFLLEALDAEARRLPS